jgi:hypothetical protein
MNKRIKELAAQLGEPSTWGAERPVGPGFAGSRWAGWSDFHQDLQGYNTPLYDMAQLEKFAELIVKECAELTLDYKNDDHYNGWLDYRDEIKKHFGIKEN